MFKKVAHCVTREWQYVDIKDKFEEKILIAVGKNLQEACDIAEEVEHLSHMYLQARIVGEPNVLSDKEMDEVLNRFRSYGRWEKE